MSFFRPVAGAGAGGSLLAAVVAAVLSCVAPNAWTSTWTGDVDNTWNEAGNWNGGIPGVGTDATIAVWEMPEDRQTVILDGESGVAGSLNAETAMNLRIRNGGTLDVENAVYFRTDFAYEGPTEDQVILTGEGSSLSANQIISCELSEFEGVYTGRMNTYVEDGAELSSTGRIVLSAEEECYSFLYVRGEGSLVDGGDNLEIGDSEYSIVDISGGAIVKADSIQTGSHGSTTMTIGGENGSDYRQPGLLSVPPDRAVSGSANIHFEHDRPDYEFANENDEPVSFSGALQVWQRGPGTTRLRADSPDFHGSLIAENGTFDVGASYPQANTTVRFGATLKAQGVLGSLNARGTVKPGGDSIGDFTVNTSYSQESSATVEAQISPDGASDFIDVNGTAEIEGGTLSVEMAPGDYSIGDEFVILEAEDGVIGAGFSGLEQSPADPRLEIVQSANQIRIRVVGSPELGIDPPVSDFGAVVLEGTQTRTVTLGNSGPIDLEIDMIEAPAAPFTRTGGSCASVGTTVLPPGVSCTIDYTFSPESLGPVSQELAVQSNDNDGPTSFTLEGEGAVAAGLEISSSFVDFGDWPQGESSTAETLTIVSTGEDPLEIDSLTFEGDHPGDFEVADETCTGEALAPGETCEVDLIFTPGGPGERFARLLIESNSPESPADVDLSGNLDVIFSDQFNADATLQD